MLLRGSSFCVFLCIVITLEIFFCNEISKNTNIAFYHYIFINNSVLGKHFVAATLFGSESSIQNSAKPVSKSTLPHHICNERDTYDSVTVTSKSAISSKPKSLIKH